MPAWVGLGTVGATLVVVPSLIICFGIRSVYQNNGLVKRANYDNINHAILM
jgi:hypothetical protein